jgi:D-alanine transaminase
VYGGRLFRLAQHLQRLQNSLDGVRIGNPLTVDAWRELLEELVHRNSGSNQAVYLQVTRGVAPKRDHAFPTGVRPTIFAMSNPLPEARDIPGEQGIHAITLPDIRWQHCNIKAITLLPNIMLRQQAVEADTAEAILIKDGYATEGAASNIFIVRNGVLITPPKGPTLLPGITRDLIIDLAADNAVPYREAGISEAELHSAGEIWLTSSTREISPVVRLNDTVVGDGRPGPVWKNMIALFQTYKDAIHRGVAA